MRYSPKHMITAVQNSRKAKALAILMISLILISAVTAGAVAILRDTASTVTETLETAEVTCEVNSDYSVKNTSDIPALIRVRVVVNKTDGGDIIPGEVPDYTVNSDWTRIGDYIYYNGIVTEADGSADTTTVPITFSETVEDDTEVLILAEAIQAASDAAADKWGAAYSDGSWS